MSEAEIRAHEEQVFKPSDVILLIVRMRGKVERRSIHDIFFILLALGHRFPRVSFVKGLEQPYSSYIEHEIISLRSLGFIREEIVQNRDGVSYFYELTVDGEIVLHDFIRKERRYLELGKFIELLPLSPALLQKFAKALFMKRRNVPAEEWGMTEEEATEAVETLSRLLRLGRL
jgi:hypothetical protein